jgi:hypothetical protein
VEVPEKTVPYFKVSKELKKLIEDANPVIEDGSSPAAESPARVPSPDAP